MMASPREHDVSAPRRPAGDLITAVIDNMRENLERLRYSVVVPSRYAVLLSPGEFARLEGLIPRLQAETVRALDEELDRLNRRSWIERRVGGWLGRRRPSLENADAEWHVEFLPDVDGELEHPHDIVVHSELRLPGEPDLGVGERTRRITTVHAGAVRSVRQQTSQVSAPRPATAPDALQTDPPLAPFEPGRLVYARLSYADAAGAHRYDVVRDSTTLGRGGVVYPVDVRLTTSEDVSREHARIRRDAVTGRFYLIDLSTLGTTINGRHVPRGYDDADGAKRENGVETELPAGARIGLAETVFIDFATVDQ